MLRKTLKLTVLASDFENNSWYNTDYENGCPMQRAFKRAGLLEGGVNETNPLAGKFYNTSTYIEQRMVFEAERIVNRMFMGEEPIVDFSFDALI